jgi:predicted aspartyl protease
MNRSNVLARLLLAFGWLPVVYLVACAPASASTLVRFKQVQNQIVVQVTVNSAGPFDFIFDTGASSTVIDLALAGQLALSPIESSSVLTAAGSERVRRFRLNTLALGPKSAQNLTVLCADLREIHLISSKLRGVLGQNFLSEFDYILNYREQRIEFEENGDFANALIGARLPVERERGRVLIRTQPSSPQKQASILVMDSGASTVVVFKVATQGADLEIDLDFTPGAIVSTASGTTRVSTGRLRKLRIGDEKFQELPVRIVENPAAASRPENGLLPTSLFRSIYFNNTHSFVILNPRLTKYRHVAETR